MSRPRSTEEREALRREMAECACVMWDEILAIERDFAPLEEELHRLATDAEVDDLSPDATGANEA